MRIMPNFYSSKQITKLIENFEWPLETVKDPSLNLRLINGDELTEAMLIDYQGARNSSPVSDLMYFLFTCTHHEARVEYYYEWLDYYHSQLENSLSNFGIKANYVYPRDQLDADMKRYGKLALGNSIVTNSMIVLKPEEASKVKDQMESADMSNINTVNNMEPTTMLAYKKKLIGILESFDRFGLL